MNYKNYLIEVEVYPHNEESCQHFYIIYGVTENNDKNILNKGYASTALQAYALAEYRLTKMLLDFQGE